METKQKTKEEIMAQMNADAKEAGDEFIGMRDKMSDEELSTLKTLSDWWEHWYLKAGHKRLAYILIGKKLSGG